MAEPGLAGDAVGPAAGAGAVGGHGAIRYTVQRYEPGRQVVFEFGASMPLVGTHALEVMAGSEPGHAVLRHTILAQATGRGRLIWPLAIRWLHDALIEDLLDRAATAIGQPQPAQHAGPGGCAPCEPSGHDQARRAGGIPTHGMSHRSMTHSCGVHASVPVLHIVDDAYGTAAETTLRRMIFDHHGRTPAGIQNRGFTCPPTLPGRALATLRTRAEEAAGDTGAAWLNPDPTSPSRPAPPGTPMSSIAQAVVQASPPGFGEDDGAALLGAPDPIQVEQPGGQRGPERAGAVMALFGPVQAVADRRPLPAYGGEVETEGGQLAAPVRGEPVGEVPSGAESRSVPAVSGWWWPSAPARRPRSRRAAITATPSRPAR